MQLRIPILFLCTKEDLNLYPFRDNVLSVACLPFHHSCKVLRVGIEPTFSVLQTEVLPLNYQSIEPFVRIGLTSKVYKTIVLPLN